MSCLSRKSVKKGFTILYSIWRKYFSLWDCRDWYQFVEKLLYFCFFNFKKHTYIRGKTCISQSHIDIINCELYKFSSLKQTELDFYKIGFLVSWGWCKSAGIVLWRRSWFIGFVFERKSAAVKLIRTLSVRRAVRVPDRSPSCDNSFFHRVVKLRVWRNADRHQVRAIEVDRFDESDESKVVVNSVVQRMDDDLNKFSHKIVMQVFIENTVSTIAQALKPQ